MEDTPGDELPAAFVEYTRDMRRKLAESSRLGLTRRALMRSSRDRVGRREVEDGAAWKLVSVEGWEGPPRWVNQKSGEMRLKRPFVTVAAEDVRQAWERRQMRAEDVRRTEQRHVHRVQVRTELLARTRRSFGLEKATRARAGWWREGSGGEEEELRSDLPTLEEWELGAWRGGGKGDASGSDSDSTRTERCEGDERLRRVPKWILGDGDEFWQVPFEKEVGEGEEVKIKVLERTDTEGRESRGRIVARRKVEWGVGAVVGPKEEEREERSWDTDAARHWEGGKAEKVLERVKGAKEAMRERRRKEREERLLDPDRLGSLAWAKSRSVSSKRGADATPPRPPPLDTEKGEDFTLGVGGRSEGSKGEEEWVEVRKGEFRMKGEDGSLGEVSHSHPVELALAEVEQLRAAGGESGGLRGSMRFGEAGVVLERATRGQSLLRIGAMERRKKTVSKVVEADGVGKDAIVVYKSRPERSERWHAYLRKRRQRRLERKRKREEAVEEKARILEGARKKLGWGASKIKDNSYLEVEPGGTIDHFTFLSDEPIPPPTSPPPYYSHPSSPSSASWSSSPSIDAPSDTSIALLWPLETFSDEEHTREVKRKKKKERMERERADRERLAKEKKERGRKKREEEDKGESGDGGSGGGGEEDGKEDEDGNRVDSSKPPTPTSPLPLPHIQNPIPILLPEPWTGSESEGSIGVLLQGARKKHHDTIQSARHGEVKWMEEDDEEDERDEEGGGGEEGGGEGGGGGSEGEGGKRLEEKKAKRGKKSKVKKGDSDARRRRIMSIPYRPSSLPTTLLPPSSSSSPAGKKSRESRGRRSSTVRVVPVSQTEVQGAALQKGVTVGGKAIRMTSSQHTPTSPTSTALTISSRPVVDSEKRWEETREAERDQYRRRAVDVLRAVAIATPPVRLPHGYSDALEREIADVGGLQGMPSSLADVVIQVPGFGVFRPGERRERATAAIRRLVCAERRYRAWFRRRLARWDAQAERAKKETKKLKELWSAPLSVAVCEKGRAEVKQDSEKAFALGIERRKRAHVRKREFVADCVARETERHAMFCEELRGRVAEEVELRPLEVEKAQQEARMRDKFRVCLSESAAMLPPVFQQLRWLRAHSDLSSTPWKAELHDAIQVSMPRVTRPLAPRTRTATDGLRRYLGSLHASLPQPQPTVRLLSLVVPGDWGKLFREEVEDRVQRVKKACEREPSLAPLLDWTISHSRDVSLGFSRGWRLLALFPAPAGPSLAQRLERASRRSEGARLALPGPKLLYAWMLQLARAVAALHAQDLPHGRLCPESIWLPSAAAWYGLGGGFGAEAESHDAAEAAGPEAQLWLAAPPLTPPPSFSSAAKHPTPWERAREAGDESGMGEFVVKKHVGGSRGVRFDSDEKERKGSSGGDGDDDVDGGIRTETERGLVGGDDGGMEEGEGDSHDPHVHFPPPSSPAGPYAPPSSPFAPGTALALAELKRGPARWHSLPEEAKHQSPERLGAWEDAAPAFLRRLGPDALAAVEAAVEEKRNAVMRASFADDVWAIGSVAFHSATLRGAITPGTSIADLGKVLSLRHAPLLLPLLRRTNDPHAPPSRRPTAASVVAYLLSCKERSMSGTGDETLLSPAHGGSSSASDVLKDDEKQHAVDALEVPTELAFDPRLTLDERKELGHRLTFSLAATQLRQALDPIRKGKPLALTRKIAPSEEDQRLHEERVLREAQRLRTDDALEREKKELERARKEMRGDHYVESEEHGGVEGDKLSKSPSPSPIPTPKYKESEDDVLSRESKGGRDEHGELGGEVEDGEEEEQGKEDGEKEVKSGEGGVGMGRGEDGVIVGGRKAEPSVWDARLERQLQRPESAKARVGPVSRIPGSVATERSSVKEGVDGFGVVVGGEFDALDLAGLQHRPLVPLPSSTTSPVKPGSPMERIDATSGALWRAHNTAAIIGTREDVEGVAGPVTGTAHSHGLLSSPYSDRRGPLLPTSLDVGGRGGVGIRRAQPPAAVQPKPKVLPFSPFEARREEDRKGGQARVAVQTGSTVVMHTTHTIVKPSTERALLPPDTTRRLSHHQTLSEKDSAASDYLPPLRRPNLSAHRPRHGPHETDLLRLGRSLAKALPKMAKSSTLQAPVRKTRAHAVDLLDSKVSDLAIGKERHEHRARIEAFLAKAMPRPPEDERVGDP